MYEIDDSKNHIMCSHLVGDGYVVMAWPKNLPARYLPQMRGVVNLQIDTFIKSARRESEREEAARLEYESWTAPNTATGGKE